MNHNNMLEYRFKNNFIYNIQGASKLLFLILVSIACMIIYHIWFLLGITLLSLFLFGQAQIKWHQVSLVVKSILILLLINNIIIFCFFGKYGTFIYNSSTTIGFGLSFITREQLFYQLNLILKYCCIIPLFLVFIVTTNTSELAASLNKLGINYKISYAFSLAIRYIPEIQKDFANILRTQQARGMQILSKTNFITKKIVKIKQIIIIIIPLIFFNLDKIDIITNAMQLRRFGQNKKRTWYFQKPFCLCDLLTILLSILLLLLSIYLLIINDTRFYYPFKKTPLL